MSKTNISDSPIYKAIVEFREKYKFDKSLSGNYGGKGYYGPSLIELARTEAAPNITSALEEFQRAHQAKIQQDTAGF